MLTQRSFITTAATFALSAMMGLSPALARGGNDPIGGLNITVKQEQSAQRIKPFSLNASELKRLNAFQGADRPTFVLKTIGKRIGAGESFVKSGMSTLGDIWCGPCKMVNEIAAKFTDAKVTYSLVLTFQEDGTSSPTKIIPPKVTQGSPRVQELPVE